MNIITVIGARPQFVKAAVVSRALKNAGIAESIIHTGQHYDQNMSDVFFEELGIPKPAHQLAIGSDSHGAQTGEMIKEIERVLIKTKPDALLVYGDTNSTLAGSLAAAKLHIPIAHVEAGLRSYNRKMPEEINRVMTDHLSTWLFAPTQLAVTNLQKEGIADNKTYLIGDVMFDAVLYYTPRAVSSHNMMEALNLTEKNYVLTTVHRASNTDDVNRLRAIFEALNRLANEVSVVLPLHPRTRAALQKNNLNTLLDNISVIEPQGFLSMMQLEKNAKLIITDSGGIQKEAYFHGVPCATLRFETEWLELLESGWNQLVPPKEADFITDKLRKALHFTPTDRPLLYGEGEAGTHIADILLRSA